MASAAAAGPYACDRCGTRDAAGYTVKQVCLAFETATGGTITAARAHQSWTETLGESSRPGQPQLAHLAECPHTICIRCALETTFVAEDRTCPACGSYSYVLGAFVDLLIENDPLHADEKVAEVAADMRRVALVDVDHAGSSCDEEEARLELEDLEKEALRQARVAKKYIDGHRHIRTLLSNAAAAGYFVNADMCRYRDGLLELVFDQEVVGLAPVVELFVLVMNSHVCKLHKLMGEHTQLPPWAVNVMEVTAA
jgi:hypothetical protein